MKEGEETKAVTVNKRPFSLKRKEERGHVPVFRVYNFRKGEGKGCHPTLPVGGKKKEEGGKLFSDAAAGFEPRK